MTELAERLPVATDKVIERAQRAAHQATVPVPVERARSRFFLLVAASALVGYLALLLLVRSNREIRADVEATIRFQKRDHPILARIMEMVSWLGFRPQSLLLPISAIISYWLLRFRLESLFLVAAWTSSFISFYTKRLVKRPRPDGKLFRVSHADIRDTSFPSGHTLHYVAFWGFFTYLTTTSIRNRALRLLSVSIFGPLIALVGPSRVYLGHHWLTDVLASYLLGITYLIGLVSAYRWIKDRSRP